MASILDRILGTKADAPESRIQAVGTQRPTPVRTTDVSGLLTAYSRNEIAFACIQIKRTAMQDPQLLVETRASDGTWQAAAGHPVTRLLRRPMPDLDGATFFGLAVASMDIANVFYAEKIRSASGALVGLNPLNPARMAPWNDARGVQQGYTWRDGATRVNFTFEELLVRQARDWANASPLQVALGAIDADTAQTDFIRAFFDNGGQPGGILKVKGTYSQEKADALSSRWAAKYGRRGDGWHRPAVLDEHAEYQRTGSILSELDSESIRSLTESRICSPFGVPPLIVYAYVGLLRATYSNLKEAWASFWDATLSPALKAWREFLTWHLLTEFVSEDLIYADRIRLRWDLSQVAALQEDVDAIHTRAERAFRVGGITLNEYRSLIGQADDPEGDYYLRLQSFVPQPIGEAPLLAVPAPPKALPGPHSTKAARSLRLIEQEMRKRLSAYLAGEYRKAAQAVLEGR